MNDNLNIKGGVYDSVSLYQNKRFPLLKLDMESKEFTRIIDMEKHRVPDITVEPREALVDQQISIVVTGLQQHDKISVSAAVTEKKLKFVSYGHFIADSNGEVSLCKDESLGGTYTGIDTMGLFWSMVSANGDGNKCRFRIADVSTPSVVTISVWVGHLSFEQIFEDDLSIPLISTNVNRYYKSPDVKREVVRAGSVRGSLFIPKGDGPFKGVIDLFGGTVGLIEHRASLLASRGFIVLALAYVGYDDLPPDLNLSVDYFEESISWFSSHPLVKKDGIGMLAVSKGGEISLYMASMSPIIKAVVCINSTPFLSYQPYTKKDVGTLPCVCVDYKNVRTTKEGVVFRDCYTAKDSDYIEGWKHGASLLFITGEDDMTINPQHTANYIEQIPKDKIHKCQLLNYPKAGHLIEPPYAPLCWSCYNKLGAITFIWGGSPKEHNFAQEDSWKKIQSFFNETL